MDSFGNHFLAGPGFSPDKNRGNIVIGDSANHVEELFHDLRCPDHAMKTGPFRLLYADCAFIVLGKGLIRPFQSNSYLQRIYWFMDEIIEVE
ncbi:MAG: hypothetical protein ACD_75C02423G0021 [uncultured bacterium]|nr:MAG: hypothetical protein ACD_75C02423G0021 [uncultured bacterium]